MQLYLGFLMISFLFNFLLVVQFIDFLYSQKVTLKKETGEVRAASSPVFKKLREKHSLKAGTPTGLGILFLVTIPLLFLLNFMLFFYPRVGSEFVSGFPYRSEILVLLLNFFGFGLIGFYDDLMKVFGFAKTGFFGLRRWHKFLLQWSVASGTAAALYFLLGIRFIHLFFITINLGVFYIPLAAFLIVSFANAFDITSGLDGLGEGLLTIALFAFWLIAATNLDSVLQLFISIWLGALLAGLYFTVHPARAFLGNASGMAFGSTLALVGLLSGKILPLLVIGGVFLIDAGSSLIQILGKALLKRRIFSIAPIHHHFELHGWDEPKVVMRFWLAGIVLALFGLWLAQIL